MAANETLTSEKLAMARKKLIQFMKASNEKILYVNELSPHIGMNISDTIIVLRNSKEFNSTTSGKLGWKLASWAL